MWSIDADGKWNWSEAAKLLLVRAIKKNIIILNESATRTQISDAWDKIYNSFVVVGMPKMRSFLFRKVWYNLKYRAIEAKTVQQHKLRISGRLEPLSKLYEATIAVMEEAAKIFPHNEFLKSKVLISISYKRTKNLTS